MKLFPLLPEWPVCPKCMVRMEQTYLNHPYFYCWECEIMVDYTDIDEPLVLHLRE